MALTDILEKIQSEAESKAEELKAEYEQKKKQLNAEHLSHLQQMAKENDKSIETDGEKTKLKAQNEAEMEAKNALLKDKRALIEDTLEKAVDALSSAERYEDLLAEMMKKSDMESGIVIPAKGKEAATKNAVSKSGKNYTVEESSAAIRGGFILKSDRIEIDNSFETVIGKQLRGPLEIELNKLLFA